MSAAERFAMHPSGRMEWHPAHEEGGGGDPETFLLHVEFVHAHGFPRGEFTTLSTGAVTGPVRAPNAPGTQREPS